VEATAANRLVTRNAISLIFPLPQSYGEKIRAVPGVIKVCPGSWFGGIYIDEKNFFPNYAVEPRSYLDLYPELIVPEDQKAALFRDRKGALVGRKLITRFGWEIGDNITLKGTIFPGNWEFTIRGVYKGARPDTDETNLIFHWDYLDETLRKTAPDRTGQVGFFLLGVDDPLRAAEIARDVDARFKNSQAETLTETEKAFVMGFISMSEAILMAIRVVSYLVIGIILAVAANTMAMSVRERTGEFAVLKTLGFRGPAVAALVLGESLVVSLSGCLLGVGVLFPVAAVVSKQLAQYFPIFRVSGETVLLGLGAGVFVGLAAAVIPAFRVTRIRIAEGLRRIG
jgi:putative ABC transport system permease protein